MQHLDKDKTERVGTRLGNDGSNHRPNGSFAEVGLSDGELFRACFEHAPIGFAVTDVEANQRRGAPRAGAADVEAS